MWAAFSPDFTQSCKLMMSVSCVHACRSLPPDSLDHAEKKSGPSGALSSSAFEQETGSPRETLQTEKVRRSLMRSFLSRRPDCR